LKDTPIEPFVTYVSGAYVPLQPRELTGYYAYREPRHYREPCLVWVPRKT
jgi:hypothetical protein